MKKIFFILSLIIGTSMTNKTQAMVGIDCPDYRPLIVYFSATGTTAKVAEQIYASASSMNNKVHLFEIKPEQPYTDADLNWHNKNSRSSIEMADKNSRPTIANKLENIDNYDVIFLGFPIWWGREPAIIDTFLESYDFSNKLIIPFATSGSSSIDDAVANIKTLVPDAHVNEGKRFTSDISDDDLDMWTFGYVVAICPM